MKGKRTMMQAEKALRDAGWIEVPISEVHKGDEVYDLGTHGTYISTIDGDPANTIRTLRAPRPEPEYKPGTVARVRDTDGNLRDAMMKAWGFWKTVDGSLHRDSVEVLRVIAYPDGSTPTD